MSAMNQPRTRPRNTTTRLTAQRCDSLRDCAKYFGNYTQTGETTLVCMPDRGSCAPYIVIPEGGIALATQSGRFIGVVEPGLYWCLPWTQVEYFVNKQNIVYDIPVRSCPTSDDLLIQIDVSIVIQMEAGESEQEQNLLYQTCLNVGDLNSMLEAIITERVRVLARSINSSHAYNLRGHEQEESMLAYMRSKLQGKGIKIRNLIVTNVILPPRVADDIQRKTVYHYLNTLERKQQAFELRKINDVKELQYQKELRVLEREEEKENYKREVANKNQEIKRVQANKARLISEMQQEIKTEVSKIYAKVDVETQEILAEAKLNQTDIIESGNKRIMEEVAKGEAYCREKLADAAKLSATLNAEALEKTGQAERQLVEAFKMKRRHEENMEKLKSLGNIGSGAIFGNQGDNLMAQLAAFDYGTKKQNHF